MTILFISRKGLSGIGGLPRFFIELTIHFPKPYHRLSPDSLGTLIKLPFLNIDLIHLCDATLLPIGVLLKVILRKSLTLTAHGLDLTYDNFFYQLMLKVFLPFSDAIILDSQSAKELLFPFRIKNYKVTVIHPGISIDKFKITKSIRLPNFAGNTILLTVGNLVSRKGHVWFIKKVFSKLSDDFVYLIVGDGPERYSIESLITKLKLTERILLLDRLTDVQLSYLFKKADIYICQNQKIKYDFEGFGIACGEAAAMGLPVVASNVDGISEVIKDGENGLLVNPSPHEFIEAINSLKNPLKRRLLGKKARLYTKRGYNWNKTIKAYIKVFEQVVGKT